MATLTVSKNPAVLSYSMMRRAVGLIALFMPFALALGAILVSLVGPLRALPHPILQRSISDYYYTPMRDYYVGSLCAIAAFLACSRGYDLSDEIAGYLAGALTLGVALFPPVNPHSAAYTRFEVDIGFIHTGFATLMFLVLAYFCIFLFRRSSPDRPLTPRKRHRNRIYGACGATMIVCIVVMVTLTLRAVSQARHPSHLLFWFESLALAAFGIAWLTKGEGILKDKPHNHHRPAGVVLNAAARHE